MARNVVRNIIEFGEVYDKLKESSTPSKEWKLIFNLFEVVTTKGEMYVPDTFYNKVHKWFGKLDDPSMEEAVLRVEEQTIGEVIIF